jgi:hypothetical protein
MGQIDAAVRQRQNEGLDLGTLQSNLGILGAQSYSDNFVNQLRAQNAGTSSPWLSALSTVLGSVGSGISKNVSYTPSGGFSLGTGAS